MAITVDFEYNNQDIPGVEGFEEVVNSNVDQLSMIGRDGIKTNTGKLGGRAITINGTIQSTDGTKENVLSQWSTLLNKLYDVDGGNNKAYLEVHSELRLLAQLSSVSSGYERTTAGMHALRYRLGFLSDEPYWEAAATTTDTGTNLSSGGFVQLTKAGGAPCWPTITVSSATGINSDIVIAIAAISATWTFGANVTAGNSLVIDMKNHTVTNAGSDAIANVDHPDSDWFYLPGAGVALPSIAITFAGGASDVTMAIAYNPSYHTFPDI